MILSKHRDRELGETYWFWCPGCEQAHRYDSRWKFNGNMQRPTFTPSLLLQGEKRCHLFLTDGELNFCGDSEHSLAGKVVDLPELPDWLMP